jgi:hypothetical protein
MPVRANEHFDDTDRQRLQHHSFVVPLMRCHADVVERAESLLFKRRGVSAMTDLAVRGSIRPDRLLPCFLDGVGSLCQRPDPTRSSLKLKRIVT